jgi:hypothetical protein
MAAERSADVVVALEFRRYQNFFFVLNERYITGI